MPLQLPSKPILPTPLSAEETPPVSLRPKSRRPKSRRTVLSSLSAEMVFTRPWFISESAGNSLEIEYLMYLQSGGRPLTLWDDDEDDTEEDDNWPFDTPKYPITDDGLACIPVRGTLMHSDYAFAYSFATSYSGIAAMCAHAMGSDQVKGILFCHNSPGGMATSSMFDLCDDMYGMRGQKPMAALSQDSC